MTTRQLFVCIRCGRDNFRSHAGLKQHLNSSQNCRASDTLSNGLNVANNSPGNNGNLLYQRNNPVPRGMEMMDQNVSIPAEAQVFDVQNLEAIRLGYEEDNDENDFGNGATGDEDSANEALPQVVAMDGDPGLFRFDNGNFEIEIPQVDGELLQEDDSSVESVIMCGQDLPEGVDPKHLYVERFRYYVQNCQEHFADFSAKEEFAIKLLDALRRKRATLDTYETVLEVFFKHLGVLSEQQTLRDTPEYIGRQTLMKKLAIRYGAIPYQRAKEDRDRKLKGLKKEKNTPYYLETPIVLPHSKAKVDVIHFDFREQLVSLLTDPRLKDEHFCHHANDPLAPPPASFTTVGEIITGLSYRKTYQAIITSPDQQMLLPVLFYVDATSTGQFTDLKVEGVKFSLGCLTNEVSGHG